MFKKATNTEKECFWYTTPGIIVAFILSFAFVSAMQYFPIQANNRVITEEIATEFNIEKI